MRRARAGQLTRFIAALAFSVFLIVLTMLVLGVVFSSFEGLR